MVFGLVGLLFNIVTFPGMIVNGLVEMVFAKALGAPSYNVRLRDDVTEEQFAMVCEELGLDVNYLNELDPEMLEGLTREKLSILDEVIEMSKDEAFDDGEVLIHYTGMNFSRVLLVASLPFVVSSALCFGIYLVGLPVAAILGAIVPTDALWWITMWLGVSMGSHAFPNGKATDALWNKSSEASLPLKLVGYPFAAASVVVSLLEFLWIDAIYALLLFFVVEEGIYGSFGLTLVP